ncbi:MAG: hypothetical protein IJH45_05050 [Firmicutes bacterium]|nr:hypothetical protein [Bacillota bacterium]
MSASAAEWLVPSPSKKNLSHICFHFWDQFLTAVLVFACFQKKFLKKKQKKHKSLFPVFCQIADRQSQRFAKTRSRTECDFLGLGYVPKE